MKAKDIKVGGVYAAKVSGRLVNVRVDAIRGTQKFSRSSYSGKSEHKDTTVYDVTNLATKRKITFRSAMKFRWPAESVDAAKERLEKLQAIRNVRELFAQY